MRRTTLYHNKQKYLRLLKIKKNIGRIILTTMFLYMKYFNVYYLKALNLIFFSKICNNDEHLQKGEKNNSNCTCNRQLTQ